MENQVKNQVNQLMPGSSLKPGNQAKKVYVNPYFEQHELEQEVTATVKLAEFYDEKIKGMTEYLHIEMENFFGDPDIVALRLEPKWDSDKDTLKYRFKKILKTSDNITLTGKVFLHTYFNKKKRDYTTYAAIFFINPFAPDYPIELQCKGKSLQNLFRTLMSDLWQAEIESDEQEPVADNSGY